MFLNLIKRAKQLGKIRQLLDERNRFLSILDETKAVVYLKDRKGRYLFFNRSFGEIFGVSREKTLGKTDYDVFPKEIADAFAANDKKVIESGRAIEAEEIAPHHDGIHTYIALKFPMRDSKGSCYGVCGISTDITDRKRLEQQLQKSQKMEATGLLAGGIAHDFNNMLGVILMNCESILERVENVPPQVINEVMEINRMTERATILTRQLLAFSKRQVLEPRVLNLNYVVGEFSWMIRKLVGEQIELQVALGRDLKQIKIDPGQLEQVLINLTLNAKDAMPRGGKLRIETRNASADEIQRIAGTANPSVGYVALVVSDTGCGMEQKTLERIFEPFFTTKEKGKGTGLGLSTVFGIVKQSGGEIVVDSELKKGATFKIYLPQYSGPVQIEAKEKDVKPDVLKGTETILLVEDETPLRHVTSKQLRLHGYEVLEAGDGVEGMDVYRKNKDKIQLVITDVIMPKLNGPDFVEQLRSELNETSLKVLFLSGYPEDQLDKQGVSSNEKAFFLEKPYSSKLLLKKIREILC